MKELFYSQSESILFWIAGYTKDLNTYNVIDILDDIKSNALKLLERVNSTELNHRIDEINTTEITKSTRYKRMRVFWIKTNVIPVEAFKIGTGEGEYPHKDDWTMWEWLSN